MLYVAPRQSGLLAADLRSSARQAAGRDRMQRAVNPATVEFRHAAPSGTRRSLLAVVRWHMRQAPATRDPAR